MTRTLEERIKRAEKLLDRIAKESLQPEDQYSLRERRFFSEINCIRKDNYERYVLFIIRYNNVQNAKLQTED